MADKIANFEDYKKKEMPQEPKADETAGEVSVKTPGDTTMDIQIEDPYNFFNAEEREEYFRQREKEREEKLRNGAVEKAEGKPVKKEEESLKREEKPENREDRPVEKEEKSEIKEDRPEKREEKPVREKNEPAAPKERPRRREELRERYEDEEYDEDYDEEYDDEEDEEDDRSLRLLVRVCSIITGVIILAFIILILKVKVYDTYFAPDPDEAPAQQETVALPEGYTEANTTYTVIAKSLNLRIVPNTESDATIAEAVAEGTELKGVAVSSDGKWAMVEYNGQTLYAYLKYLEEKTN